jgi:hypothetical protein
MPKIGDSFRKIGDSLRREVIAELSYEVVGDLMHN